MSNKMAMEAEVTESAEPGEILASEIGSDQDFADRARQRAEWKDLEKKERQETSSVRRQSLMREGFHAGFEAAAQDYINEKATVEHFEELRANRETNDFYSIGFELGYYRKLAELLLN